MARGKRRPKPMSPKAGIKRTRYGCGGKLKSWDKKELDEFVKKCRNSTVLRSRKHSPA